MHTEHNYVLICTGRCRCGSTLQCKIDNLTGKKPAEIYRIEQAGEKMLPGRPEPPNLPGFNVLKTAKH